MDYLYLKINGIASDLRFAPENYKPGTDEIVATGEPLPPLSSLHDASVLAACIASGVSTARKLSDLPIAATADVIAADAVPAPNVISQSD